MALFTGIIFSGSYTYKENDLKVYFEKVRGDKAERVSTSFAHAVSEINKERSASLSNPFVFNAYLLDVIDRHNKNIKSQFIGRDGISDKEIEGLLVEVQVANSIKYNEAVLSSVFEGKKKQLLLENTSWMFDDQRLYSSIENFKKDLLSKTRDINKNVGQEYYIGTDGGTLLSLTKIFIVTIINVITKSSLPCSLPE